MGVKHAYIQGGVSNCRGKRYKRKEGHQNNITGKWQAYETKINRNLGKITGRFYMVFPLNKAREISYFQEYQTKIWNQHTLQKADPETFSFWVDDIFAKK